MDRLSALPKPIPFGLIGAGSAGKGILYQSLITPGVRCLGLADIQPQAALDAARSFGLDPLVVASEADLEEAIRRGRLAVCEDAGLLTACDSAAAVSMLRAPWAKPPASTPKPFAGASMW